MSKTPQTKTVQKIGKLLFDEFKKMCLEHEDWVDGYFYERSLTCELNRRLNVSRLPTVHQQCYPGSAQTCDLVTRLGADSAGLWTEVKGAWLFSRPFEHDGKLRGGRNKPLRKHLFDKKESALRT